MAAWLQIRSCWCLTSLPGLQRGETVINSHHLSVCVLDSEMSMELIPEVILALVSFVAPLKKIQKKCALCFPRVFYFLPAL